MNKKIVSAIGGLALLIGLSACGKAMEPFKDAGISETNDLPATLIRMPDGFSNIAAKCDGTARVYTVFHGDEVYGSVAVVPNHPACR